MIQLKPGLRWARLRHTFNWKIVEITGTAPFMIAKVIYDNTGGDVGYSITDPDNWIWGSEIEEPQE